MKSFLIILLFAASGSTKEVCRPCVENPDLLKGIPKKNLKSGIPIVIARVLTAGGKTVFEESYEIHFDLWDDMYIVEAGDSIAKLGNVSVFQSFLCARLALSEERAGAAGKFEAVRYHIALNPIGRDLSEKLEKWAEKNAGTYNNWGMKIKWDSGSKGGTVLFSKEIRLWKE